MNKKKVIILLLSILVILVVAPQSFARPQYLANLTATYGGGSCSTCHVIASGGGPRHSNGTFGQHNPNGTFEPRDSNRSFEQRNSSNRSFGGRNSSRTFPLNSYGTLFENQPDHATDPGAALIAIGQPPATAETSAENPIETTATSTGSRAAPGFGIAVSLIGLFACAVMAGRRNR